MNLARRDDGAVPPVSYNRQLVVAMPKFSGINLDLKDYVFARDLDDRVYDADGFTMRSAVLTEDPYSGAQVGFRCSEVKSDWVAHIDHVVAVADAWNRWALKGPKWRRFCNDSRPRRPTIPSIHRRCPTPLPRTLSNCSITSRQL